MEKETLEEAAERINCESNIPYDITNELITMAKWQAERMYTEEEVLKIINKFNEIHYYPSESYEIKEWFEQFHKK